MSPNRIVAVLTPLVFAPAAGAIATWIANNIPGAEISARNLEEVFIGGALIGARTRRAVASRLAEVSRPVRPSRRALSSSRTRRPPCRPPRSAARARRRVRRLRAERHRGRRGRVRRGRATSRCSTRSCSRTSSSPSGADASWAHRDSTVPRRPTRPRPSRCSTTIGGRWWNVYIGGPESGGARLDAGPREGVRQARHRPLHAHVRGRGSTTARSRARRAAPTASRRVRIAKAFGYSGNFPLCLDVELHTYRERAGEGRRVHQVLVRRRSATPARAQASTPTPPR